MAASNGNGSIQGKGLSFADIEKLMASTRQRGIYLEKLDEFLQSDEPALNVSETWPLHFGQKPATTLYQGFRNAAEKAKADELVSIKQTDGNVYLLHNERVQLMIAANAADTK